MTDAQIDAVAMYLRDTTQAGKRLTLWRDTPKAAKKKWIALANGAIDAYEAAKSADENK